MPGFDAVPDKTGRALAAILIAGVLMRAAFLVILPFDDKHSRCGLYGFNDELSHLHYVEYLVEHHGLPVQTHSVKDADAFVRNEFEYYHPPLAYLSAAPFYAAADFLKAGWGPYGARVFSLLCGLATVWMVFRVGALFHPKVGLLSACFLALFPTHVYYSALVSNDSLSWLLSAFLLHEILKTRHGNGPISYPSFSSHLRIALILAAGLWCKSSCLTLLPLAFVLPAVKAWKERRPAVLLYPLLAVGAALALATPYYLRNRLLYGNFLALETGAGFPTPFLIHPTVTGLHSFLGWTAVTFWSPFNPPAGFFGAGKWLLVALTAGFSAVLCAGWMRSLRPGESLRGDPRALVLWANILLSGLGYIHYNLYQVQSDVRLAFGGLCALLTVLSLAIFALTKGFSTFADSSPYHHLLSRKN